MPNKKIRSYARFGVTDDGKVVGEIQMYSGNTDFSFDNVRLYHSPDKVKTPWPSYVKKLPFHTRAWHAPYQNNISREITIVRFFIYRAMSMKGFAIDLSCRDEGVNDWFKRNNPRFFKFIDGIKEA